MGKQKRKVIFLDTEQFVANKLSFSNAAFERLSNLVKDGIAKVLLTEIVEGEVRRHIRKELREAKKKLGLQFGGLFQNLEHAPTPPPLSDEYWADAERELTDQFMECCRRLKAEIIPTKPEFVKVVFEWYFAHDAPFDSSKRKGEFPDAFSIACINDWAGKQNETVYVISKDEAFRITAREVTRSSKLIRVESLGAFFELFPDPQLASSIKAAFVAFLEEEVNGAFGEEQFRELGFYVESDDESESRSVESVSVIYSESDWMYVAEAKGGRAVLVGNMYVHFFAEISGMQNPVESAKFVPAEVKLTYDEKNPSYIDVQSVAYDGRWGIGVSAPLGGRRRT